MKIEHEKMCDKPTHIKLYHWYALNSIDLHYGMFSHSYISTNCKGMWRIKYK